ncbi:glyoxylase-like metal-dependent hydrolase (beta-lactamase superfamily II) [Micromonospora palomenae]|uniref:Glyoxylase-like metal-dependent hydrolase (Beta-lactamase superfamily II) n=1 Tax=Micromonospora palomenae TaxID=1461247 RepID=A0A561WTF5_9ACTN|nr:MBL fold metallo-hydrolase [Micromonospora palomenae]TWG27139.1 glyoxylase-like metal-dependent hydrolase (beta-lactamase superfamily II) [Micromonospora palomenae]
MSETPYSDLAERARELPTAPVPQAALGPEIPEAGYVLEEIADGVFWLSEGMYQMMFVVTDEGVIAVDAPPTLGHNILRAIRSVTSRSITQVVYSHQHSDHVGAMSVYPEDVPRYAHRITAERLALLRDPHRPLPTHVFDDTLTIEAGDHSLQLDYKGPNHAEGNIFVYAPTQRVLMLVDVIFPGRVPFSNLAVSANIPGFVNAQEQALAYPFDKLVGGHVTRPGTPDDVRTQIEYLRDLRSTTEAALSSVDVQKILAPVDATNAWAIFKAYLDAVAARAADELVPRWSQRLGGADMFTLPNAWAMAEALRLDYGSMGPFGIAP